MDLIISAVVLVGALVIGWRLYRASERADAQRRSEAERGLEAPIAAKPHGAPRAKRKVPSVLLIVLAVFAGMVGLGALIPVIDPEGVKERAAAAEAEREAKAAVEREAAAAKRQAGFHCLSAWDGSHPELVKALKSTLRDPDSFEHIETRITPLNEKGVHVLMMNYRARNGFGGMNVGQLAATVRNSDCSFEVVANESG